MSKSLTKFSTAVFFICLSSVLINPRATRADWWQECAAEREKFCRGVPVGRWKGAPKGSPPWGLSLIGNHYQVQLRNGNRVQNLDLGSAATDLGRWTHWMLHYKPDSSGANTITELDKDGARVASLGVANAFPSDNRAYFKIGIYKWWWRERPSDVSDRTVFFGDVSIFEKRRNTAACAKPLSGKNH